jgi:hypothetical protein
MTQEIADMISEKNKRKTIEAIERILFKDLVLDVFSTTPQELILINQLELTIKSVNQPKLL